MALNRIKETSVQIQNLICPPERSFVSNMVSLKFLRCPQQREADGGRRVQEVRDQEEIIRRVLEDEASVFCDFWMNFLCFSKTAATLSEDFSPPGPGKTSVLPPIPSLPPSTVEGCRCRSCRLCHRYSPDLFAFSGQNYTTLKKKKDINNSSEDMTASGSSYTQVLWASAQILFFLWFWSRNLIRLQVPECPGWTDPEIFSVVSQLWSSGFKLVGFWCKWSVSKTGWALKLLLLIPLFLWIQATPLSSLPPPSPPSLSSASLPLFPVLHCCIWRSWKQKWTQLLCSSFIRMLLVLYKAEQKQKKQQCSQNWSEESSRLLDSPEP